MADDGRTERISPQRHRVHRAAVDARLRGSVQAPCVPPRSVGRLQCFELTTMVNQQRADPQSRAGRKRVTCYRVKSCVLGAGLWHRPCKWVHPCESCIQDTACRGMSPFREDFWRFRTCMAPPTSMWLAGPWATIFLVATLDNSTMLPTAFGC